MTRLRLLLLVGLVAFLAVPAGAQPATADAVQAGRFDNGRMFTLDEPPLDYFRETYDFAPDDAWFQHAQLGALRFATYCSASFVSPTGLILTNHHCARQSVTQVSVEDGVDYNEDGFYAKDMDEERMVDGLYVEQLIAIQDVTGDVAGAAMNVEGDQARQQARQQAIAAAQAQMEAEYGEGFRVQIVTLYSGGQYKAYIYKRYDNIQLVFAPETQMGYFGGDPDNFTYPRYSLDFSLFRAVDENGDPLEVEHFFRFQPEGTDPGDLVFVLGNPGSTTRMQTVAELEFRRDFNEPAILNAIASREAVYGEYIAGNPDAPGIPELTDTYFSLGNSRKAYTGRVEGLRDPNVIARRRAAEQNYINALAADADLQAQYGDIIDAIAANREALRPMGNQFGAFIGLGPGSILSSPVMGRAVLAFQYANASEEQQAELRENMLGVEDLPLELQQGLVEARLTDFETYLGENNPIVQQVLGTSTPAAAAREIAQNSPLTTVEGTEALLDSGDILSDPAVQVVAAVIPAVQQFQQANATAGAELAELSSRLALARFELYGTSIPPDATFTLRISD
ncbi:MAG: S46 family peptidase, partial [Rhodothermaceae bacterium]|nr:S46 family peptidase [Rhodothermaceae bacterium]